MNDAVHEFIASFRYLADGQDRWTLIDQPPHQGDCEDFALTVAWLIAGSWLRFWWGVLTFRFVFWQSWARGDRKSPHIALWVRGKGWIDNIHPAFGPRRHPLRWPLLPPALALILLFKRGSAHLPR